MDGLVKLWDTNTLEVALQFDLKDKVMKGRRASLVGPWVPDKTSSTPRSCSLEPRSTRSMVLRNLSEPSLRLSSRWGPHERPRLGFFTALKVSRSSSIVEPSRYRDQAS